MNVFESVLEYWKTRSKTQVFAIFSSWWVLFHFEFFYTLLFVDQDKILALKHMLKNEYIWTTFVHYHSKDFWLYQAAIALLCGLLTWFMIRWFPRLILNWAYGWERQHEFSRQRIKLGFDEELSKFKAKMAENVKQKLESEKASEDIKNELTAAWDEDFKKFKKDPAYLGFDLIIQCIYEYGGDLKVMKYDEDSEQSVEEFSVPSGVLAFVDSYDLITIDNDKGKISFTDKGRYFVRLSPAGR